MPVVLQSYRKTRYRQPFLHFIFANRRPLNVNKSLTSLNLAKYRTNTLELTFALFIFASDLIHYAYTKEK